MPIKQIFTNNWKQKLVCLILAMLFVLFAAGEQFRQGIFPRAFPLEARNIPAHLQLNSELSPVKLKIRADSEMWGYINTSDVTVYIDFAEAEAGTANYPIRYRVHNPQLVVYETYPHSLKVSMEEVGLKRMPFTVKLTGVPAEGFDVGEIEYEELDSTISGTQTTLDEVKEVSASVNVNQAQNMLKQNVKLVAYNQEGEVVSGVEITPATIPVTIEIKPKIATKTVAIKPILAASLDATYAIGDFSLTPQMVVIKGESAVIEEIEFLETEEITRADIEKGTFTKALVLNPEISIVDDEAEVTIIALYEAERE